MSDTRWSARADALQALISSYREIEHALDALKKDITQTPDTQLTAHGFGNKFSNLETLCWQLFGMIFYKMCIRDSCLMFDALFTKLLINSIKQY